MSVRKPSAARKRYKKKDPRGRRIALTRKVQNKICQMIRAGVYDYVAAEAAGISANTFREWIRRAEGKDGRPAAPVFATFATAVRLAKAEARAAMEVTVRKVDPKFVLARMYRDRPGEPDC
jgi:hypothetical protein